MSTLIVRDATLAVNGAPEARGHTGQHLNRRVVEVAEMDAATAEDCIDVLLPVMGSGEECDVEVLFALTVLGLARPELAQSRNLGTVAVGRQLASRLEQDGDAESALDVIELLRDAFPTHGALERDHDAILHRLGMVQDLAQRYFRRAQRLLAEGEKEEAVGWLREVLLLDASRSDAARLIRDLKLADTRKRLRRRRPSAGLFMALLVPIGLSALVYREHNLRLEYRALPMSQGQVLESARERLDSIETFFSEHPVWHGTFSLLAERSELRVQVAKLEREEEARLAEERRHEEESAEAATLIARRAEIHVQYGEFQEAVDDYHEALRVAPAWWPERARVERDVASVLEHMDEVQR